MISDDEAAQDGMDMIDDMNENWMENVALRSFWPFCELGLCCRCEGGHVQ